ncbi:MAG: hypothetical protein K2Q22_02935, partial [Cytophagales bacterium]|nr:hypothetical protein [Cytophagales bacterium]
MNVVEPNPINLNIQVAGGLYNYTLYAQKKPSMNVIQVTVGRPAGQTPTYVDNGYVDIILDPLISVTGLVPQVTALGNNTFRYGPISGIQTTTTTLIELPYTLLPYDADAGIGIGGTVNAVTRLNLCTGVNSCTGAFVVTSTGFVLVEQDKRLVPFDKFNFVTPFYDRSKDYSHKTVMFKNDYYTLGAFVDMRSNYTNYYGDLLRHSSDFNGYPIEMFDFRIMPNLGGVTTYTPYYNIDTYTTSSNGFLNFEDQSYTFGVPFSYPSSYYNIKSNLFDLPFGAKAIASDNNFLYIGGNFRHVVSTNNATYAGGAGTSATVFNYINKGINVMSYDGLNWNPVGSGLPSTVSHLETGGGKVYAVVNNTDLYVFTQGGDWVKKTFPNSCAYRSIKGIKYFNGTLYIYGIFTGGTGGNGYSISWDYGVLTYNPTTDLINV